MNEHALRIMLEGGGGLAGRTLRTTLWLPGKAYALAMRLRRAAYRHGICASTKAAVPVVSIGNLTAGGSGKTPLVIRLANALAARGKTPAILMRGYRSADGVSDEAALYRTRASGVILEVNPDRRAGADAAVAKGADAILLDDGMQHLKLRRDLDIVLVDATSPWGGGNTIPGGLLREPKSALAAAGAIVVTRSDQAKPQALDKLLGELRRRAPNTPVFTARHRPARLLRLDNTPLPLEELKGRNVVALSGIARPEAFHQTLAELGATVVGRVSGRDHDHFSREIVTSALETAASAGAVVVTTEKDRAKKIFSDLSSLSADKNMVGNNNVNDVIWTLGIEQEVDGEDELIGILESALR